MNLNRFHQQAAEARTQTEVPVNPAAFMACPLSFAVPQAGGWGPSVYDIAFQQAQAAVRPAPPQRDLFAVWN